MIDKEELQCWLSTLTPHTGVYIDDGGQALRSDECCEAYIEVGGEPTVPGIDDGLDASEPLGPSANELDAADMDRFHEEQRAAGKE